MKSEPSISTDVMVDLATMQKQNGRLFLYLIFLVIGCEYKCMDGFDCFLISKMICVALRRMMLSMSNKIAKHSSRGTKNKVIDKPHDLVLNFQMWYIIVGHPVLDIHII